LRARLEGCYLCRDAKRFEEIVHSLSDFDPPSLKTAGLGMNEESYGGCRTLPVSGEPRGLPVGLHFAAIANLGGAMIDGRGLFFASRAVAKSNSFLSRSQRIQELSAQFAQSEAQLQAAKAGLTQLDHAQQDTIATLGRLNQELAGAQAQLESHGASEARAQGSLSRVNAQISALDEKNSHDRSRLENLNKELLEHQSRLEELLAAKTKNDERVQNISQNLALMRENRDRAVNALSEGRLAEANARHALEVSLESERNLALRLNELSARAGSSQNEISRLRAESDDYRNQSAQKTRTAEVLQVELSALEQELAGLKNELEQQENQCASARLEMETLRQSVAQAQNSLMKARLEMGELTGRQSILVDDFKRRWGETTAIEALNWRANLYEAEFFSKADELSLEMAAVELPTAEELSARYQNLNREQLYVDCQTLRQKLEAIGPINESALEDYKAHESRYTGLKTQVDDLQAAKTELTTALMELNAQSSTLFATTFESIRANFGKTFEQLFGGGKADLVLSTPEDPLNSGIDILARPPGTQLKSLGLLSGGQKTMTAVALLFAIYQVKPSPFCVLDELDAPLDDANIGRFLAMLKSFTVYSQFLMMTHNKRTMASCDILYGVTMQERGVSRIISMRLAQAQDYSKPAPIETPAEQAAEVAASYSLDSLKTKVEEALALEKEEKTEDETAKV